MGFFERNNVSEYHLHVAPANEAARRFYRKMGLSDLALEQDGSMWRMQGTVGGHQ
jgi:hypothetical protein